MKSPFKFLDSYNAKDKAIFFGREKEIEVLYNLVNKTPLVLVYGLSGTGKTSLVQCGLSTKFDGPDWLPFYIRKEDDINKSLRHTLESALDNRPVKNLQEGIQDLFYSYFRPVYLIFDQFEELFILGKEEEKKQFMQDIRQLLDASLPCKVIFIMREEYIGEFYDFEKELPQIFDHKLRVEPMSNKGVKEVMLQSFAQFNISLEAPEEELCQLMIDNMSAGKSGIPLTYLQVYLDMMYQEDYRRTYGKDRPKEALPPLTFTKAEVETFGEIEDVLNRYLREQIAFLQRKVYAQFKGIPEKSVVKVLDIFVTKDGTKRPVFYSRNEENLELSEETTKNLGIDKEALTFHLTELENARILRFGDDQIELAHDTLAFLIDQQRTDEQRRLNDIRRRLQGDFSNWKDTGEFLSLKRLSAYEDFFPLLNLDEELTKFVHDSRTDAEAYEREKEEQQERELALANEKLEVERKAGKRQRQLSIYLVGALFAAVVVVCFAIWAQQSAISSAEEAITAKKQTIAAAKTIRVNDLASKAQNLLANGERTAAFQLAAFTEQFIEPDNERIAKVLHNCYYYNDHPERSNNLNLQQVWNRTLEGHTEEINTLDFSPDGKWLISAGKDRTARLWEVATGKEISIFKGHWEEITNVDFSPNGKYFVTSSKDATVKIWEIETGEITQIIDKSNWDIEDAKFSPDGKKLILAGMLDKTENAAILWDLALQKPLAKFTVGYPIIHKINFSPDGQWLVASTENEQLILWEVETQKKLWHLANNWGKALSVNFSPDGFSIITSYRDKTIRVLNRLNGKEKLKLKGHRSTVYATDFSPDNRYILTGSQDKIAKIWDVETGKELQNFIGHKGGVLAAKFSPNGKKVATAAKDNTVKIWEIRHSTQGIILYGHGDDVNEATFSPDGKWAISASNDNTAILWDMAMDTIVKEFKGHRKEVLSAKFSPDGKQIVTASNDKIAILWDVATKEPLRTFNGADSGIKEINFSPDGANLLTVGVDENKVSLWNKSTGEIIRTYGDGYNINTANFSPNGQWIATGNVDKKAILFDVLTGDTLRFFMGHEADIHSLDFSFDNKTLVTGSDDYTAKIWNVGNGQLIQSLEGHDEAVRMVRFSPDGKYVITASDDDTAKLWEVGKSEAIRTFEGHQEDVLAANFSPDGQSVITTSKDNTIRIWAINSEVFLKDQQKYCNMTVNAVEDNNLLPTCTTTAEIDTVFVKLSNDNLGISPKTLGLYLQNLQDKELLLKKDDATNFEKYQAAIIRAYDIAKAENPVFKTYLATEYQDWANWKIENNQFEEALDLIEKAGEFGYDNRNIALRLQLERAGGQKFDPNLLMGNTKNLKSCLHYLTSQHLEGEDAAWDKIKNLSCLSEYALTLKDTNIVNPTIYANIGQYGKHQFWEGDFSGCEQRLDLYLESGGKEGQEYYPFLMLATEFQGKNEKAATCFTNWKGIYRSKQNQFKSAEKFKQFLTNEAHYLKFISTKVNQVGNLSEEEQETANVIIEKCQRFLEELVEEK